MAVASDHDTGPSLEKRAVRHADLVPCLNAFVDSRTPGSDRKENFTIIGPGVSENPNQHVHIPEAHGFNIGGARQPPGCLNSQHSHLTAEVFVVHSGEWVFRFGVDARDGEVHLAPGDTISIPTRMFRGFENVGEDTGFLFAVLGGDDPGRVTWAPQVFELAARHGLVLLAGGKLVDTTAGETVAFDAVRETPPSPDEIAALATPAADRLASCVARADAPTDESDAMRVANWSGSGVRARRIIDDDPAGGAAIASWWPHGFSLTRLQLEAGAGTGRRAIERPGVLFVQSGPVLVDVDDARIALDAGDTLSLPRGARASIHAPTETPAVGSGEASAGVFVVEGTPAAAGVAGEG